MENKMDVKDKTAISVRTKIHAPIEKIWNYWTMPEHIVKWNYALDTWHTPRAENDLRVGGKFNYRMEAKDGSMGFDFWGIYDKIIVNEQIHSTLGDGRQVRVTFTTVNDETEIVETFEAENINSVEMQRAGWQAILDNFKKYVETH
jgi:uncharacterized protein YndB with AHSA1/START domain